MILYFSGIAVLLYFRPRLMFHRDGRWKEFGIGDVDGGTRFPFWLFCIVWAIVSFLVSFLIVGSKATAAAVVSNVAPLAPLAPLSSLRDYLNVSGPTEEAPTANEPQMKSGYYRLNTSGSKKGIPRYVYVGPDEPEDI